MFVAALRSKQRGLPKTLKRVGQLNKSIFTIMKKIIVSFAIVVLVAVSAFKLTAQEGGPQTSVCYNGYENPEWWRNDYYRRICGTCEMVFGHDFELEGTCIVAPQ